MKKRPRRNGGPFEEERKEDDVVKKEEEGKNAEEPRRGKVAQKTKRRTVKGTELTAQRRRPNGIVALLG